MADSTPVWVTMATASLALGGVLFTALVTRWNLTSQKRTEKELEGLKAAAGTNLETLKSRLLTQRDERMAKLDREKVFSKFKDPLAHSAYDLQSRIFNIIRKSFLNRYYVNGSAREQEYAIENTVFLLAQFLGWTEIIRQEVQFLALDKDDNNTKKLRQLQYDIYTHLRTDSRFGPGFRLFAGEQRSVGELMIDRVTGSPRCLGFASFLTSRNTAIDRWLDPLRDDVKSMALNVAPFEQRLIAIQHSLIDLLQFLDPDCEWFPSKHRSHI